MNTPGEAMAVGSIIMFRSSMSKGGTEAAKRSYGWMRMGGNG